MVSWSAILTSARNPIRSFTVLSKTPFLRNNVSVKIPVRNSHGEEMWVRPERYGYELFKDYLHFYVALGVIPLVGTLLYTSIFIGPATLAEIPEGYEPKHWEYHKHPVTRFIAWVIPSPQEKYERRMHWLHEVQEKQKYDRVIKKVGDLQKERQDFMAWYYQPSVNKRYLDAYREQHKEFQYRSLQTYGGVFNDEF